MAANNVTSPYFLALQNKPSSIIRINTSIAAMTVNNNNNALLYCPEGHLLLIDEQGNEIRTIWNCTCYDTALIVSEADPGSKIEVYDLCADHWNPVQTFTAPTSCKVDQQIEKIRFNSDGSCLGVILRQGSQPNYYHWFELRDPNNMTVISTTKTDLGNDQWCWLLTLPDRQFLATLWREKKFLLFDSHGELQETTEYDKNVKYLNSTALINGKYLVVQLWKPDELRFYNL
ncbi:unnamed protein product [Rotaria sordida]|uniref:Uncharacterized protein n=1 Tax=Rotaria sordida TaxID=392033 RepID=A0A815ZV67_9BILA|nr:unnamed protein product [Rotaria sordida]CAF1589635.1 unnamed protein product [Rotaria sordida]